MFEHSLFYQLPIRNQVELLNRQGAAVAHRNHKGWNITLYAINNNFVERWEKNGLEIMGSFKMETNPLEILEPYLDNFEVEPLYKI